MVVKTKQVLVKKTPASKPAVVKRVSKKAIKNTKTKKTASTHSSKVSTQLKLSSDTPKQGRVSVRIVDNTKSKTAVVKRTSIYPAVPSPFRFPVPTSKSISMVAYSFGLFFMALGTMLSAIHFPVDIGAGQIPMVANTLSTYIEPSLTDPINKLETTTTDIYSSTKTLTESVISSEEARPEPHISVIGAGGTLVGNLQIAINVPRATEVRVLLDSRTNNQLYTLGNAQGIDASTWKAYFATTKYPNGEYRLKVLINNAYGTYDYTDQTSYIISNEQKQEIVQTTTESSLSDTNSATAGDVLAETVVIQSNDAPVVMHIPNTNPVKGTVPIAVDVDSATSVKVGLKNLSNGNVYSTGFLNKESDGAWKIGWDSTRVPDGKYALTPRANISDIQTEGEGQILTVENGTVGSVPSTSTELSEVNEEIVAPLVPDIVTTISKQNPVSNFVDVVIATAPEVTSVEIYATPQKSLTAHFLGLARSETGGRWRFSWETTNSPNGEYYIYARVKTTYGFTEGGKKFVSIVNESVNDFTNEQEEKIQTLQSADDALVTIVDSAPEGESDNESPVSDTGRVTYIESVSGFVETFDVDTEIKNDIENSLDIFRMDLNKKLILLAQAERKNDVEMLKRIREEIESLRNEVISTLPKGVEKKELIEEIGQYLSQVAFELTEVTLKNETILRERVGDAVMNDSDKDEISDYDEINLYKTNPFSADSDADGHNDNIEIVQGFNPLDAEAEAPVVYESPRDTGMVREDLLIVDSIHTVERGVDGIEPKALISGKALPNSFVTLYIFSTPVVITVKTDADGNWNYIFDKTLEDGDHEVYVGITDNEGKIVAKSNPISFVKTAEAFVGETEATTPQPIESAVPSLVNSEALLTIGSILVLVLGLVLIFVGLHLRREDDSLVPRMV